MVFYLFFTLLVYFLDSLLIACTAATNEVHDCFTIANFDCFVSDEVLRWDLLKLLGVVCSTEVQILCSRYQEAVLRESKQEDA